LPDGRRRVPFGPGTSISYTLLDYRFRNTTSTPVQLRVWLDDTFLYGELRSTEPLTEKYKILEEDSHYARDGQGVFYRNSRVYRLVIDRKTNEELRRELILQNHSEVLYEYDLIPKDQIRESASCS
jgi:vancomycin resistance protein VanW